MEIPEKDRVTAVRNCCLLSNSPTNLLQIIDHNSDIYLLCPLLHYHELKLPRILNLASLHRYVSDLELL